MSNENMASTGANKVPKLKVNSLDELIIKKNAIISTAPMKSAAGIYLLDSSTADMVHTVVKVGEDVSRLKEGDQLLEFGRAPMAYEFSGQLVLVTDEYNVELAARK